MTSSILNVGQSALTAAQIGLTITGHNIANAATPGYTRQVIVQGAVAGEDKGYGFVGKGTAVTDIKRMYSEHLNSQVIATQTTKSQLNTYHTEIQQLNNMLADPAAGLSPVLQEFFKGIQNLSADPSSAAARQAMLSSSESLASRFQSMDSRLREIGEGVNTQINASVTVINVYAQQIAKLNDAIEKAQSSSEGKAPNDLLDQRDLALTELSKEAKVTLVKQGETYNVFLGNGQPLVVNTKTSTLWTAASPMDPTRTEVGYTYNGKTTLLSQSAFAGGGQLAGLMEFRSKTLDTAQNSLGRVATVLGMSFNAQHRLGQTQAGTIGADFFKVANPVVSPSTLNTGSGVVTASINNPTALTGSDYRLQYIPGSTDVAEAVKVTRLSDGEITTFPPPAATIDGVDFRLAGTPGVNDDFLIRPTANGANVLNVLITNTASIAAGAPVHAATPLSNAGTGKISPPVMSSTAIIPSATLTYNGGMLSGFPSSYPVTVTPPGGQPTTYAAGAPVPYTTAGSTLSFGDVEAVFNAPLTNGSTVTLNPTTATLTYNANGPTITGFPPNLPVKVELNGATTTYAPGVAVPYADGAKISVGGVNFVLSGAPANGDTFTLSPNTNGQGDNRNSLLLGSLQTSNLFDKGTATFQGVYSQMVNVVGSKTRELEVTSAASHAAFQQAMDAQQAESGVNLDEEAANLMRYQQAYQAAAKVMQTASQLFDILLQLGK